MNCRLFAAIALAAVISAAVSAETEPILRYDPFGRPEPRAVPLSSAASGEPVLRATLVAGARSSANLDGTIVPLGFEHRGHRLLEVNEFSVILVKDGRRIAIELESKAVAP